jgi:hypothetical protein
VTGTDTATASQTPCTAWWVASRWSPAPNSRATAAVVPYARKMKIE